MANTHSTIITCQRCGTSWRVDLARLGRPTETVYKDRTARRERMEAFRVVCPTCGTVNIHEVTFEERRNA